MSSPVLPAASRPRKSFAQVAAAAHTPRVTNEKPSNNTQNPHHSRPNGASSVKSPVISSTVSVKQLPSSTAHEQTVSSPQDSDELAEATNGANGNFRVHANTMMPPALSSIESFSRRDNSDTKSVTSRTTLTLDEKESLRPDDSASVQAAVDDDRLSVSGSRIGTSNSEARAFSDQLHEIERTGAGRLPPLHRGTPNVILPLHQRPPPGGSQFNVISATPAFQPPAPPPVLDPTQFRPSLAGISLPPDEKLMEALASPKDRLFVLKVEQDIIDFVKDSNESVLILPQTNSFYRMLSHKLADYYCLEHAVDESMQSVRISRTANCRLPISLMQMSTGENGVTPPPSAPARKIMRRGEPGDGLASESASKATSENGIGSGGEDGSLKDRSAMTREERESRYAEVRARIFKDFSEKETPEPEEGPSNSAEEPSRASSPSGKQKRSKKKKPRDDGFEPRSSYNQMPHAVYMTNGMQPNSNAQGMFQSFQDMNVSGPYHGQIPGYTTGAAAQDPSAMQRFMQQQQQWFQQMQQYPLNMQMGQSSTHGQMMDGSQGGSYNNMNVYGSPNMGQQSTPKPGHVPLANYSQGFQNTTGSPQQWQQPMPYPQMYGQTPAGYGSESNGMGSPQGFYGFPPQQQYDMNAWRAFQNQQFNPMSQSFVPSWGQQHHPSQFHPGISMHQQQHKPTSPGVMPQNSYNMHTASPRSRQSTSASHPSTISKWANSPSLPSKPPAPKENLSNSTLPSNPMASSRNM